MRRAILAAFAVALTHLAAAPARADADAFWRHWSDGQAELNGYRLVQPRYGELREGQAVLVFVTEPFSRSRLVKVDRWDPKDPDQFTALKLNHLRIFQTGIYDYRVMTSVFADPAAGFEPVEVTFTSQEWCGHVFERLTRPGGGAEVVVDSYFEGESGKASVAGPVVIEDAIFIQARGLMSGGPGSFPAGPAATLASALVRRLKHLPANKAATTFTWSGPSEVKVPAGAFTARTLSWPRPDGVGCALDVEVAAPHRILGWRCDDGERAELTGSFRSPYWQQQGEGDEKLLTKLGLWAPGKRR